MKYLQKLGKALMLPVACLPICGILMGIGYLLCPASMQGGDITGIGPMIGIFLVKAGAAKISQRVSMQHESCRIYQKRNRKRTFRRRNHVSVCSHPQSYNVTL